MARGRGHRSSSSHRSDAPSSSHRDSSPEDDAPVGAEPHVISAHSGYDPATHDPRVFIRVHPSGMEFWQPASIVRRITSIIKSMHNGEWVTWSDVPYPQRERMWERFAGIYRWDPAENHLVRSIWDRTAPMRFKESMNKARKEAAERARRNGAQDPHNPNNVLDLIPYPPVWIGDKQWEALCRGPFNTPEFRRKRGNARSNRLTLVEGSVSKHTGGSATNTVNRERLKENMGGQEPGALDLYTYLHTRKKSRSDTSTSGSGEPQWVDQRSKRIHDEYLERLTQRSQMQQPPGEEAGSSSRPPPPDDVGLWLEVTGGQRRGRMLGVGNYGDPNYVLTGESSSSRYHASSSNAEVSELRSQLEETQAKFSDEQALRIALQQSMQEMEARQERDRADIRRMMEMWQQGFFPQNPPPPPPPGPDGY